MWGSLLHPKFALAVVLAAVALFVSWRLIVRSRSRGSEINLDDLLIDDATGKISKAAAVMMGSFFVTSWIVVYQTLTDKLTDLTFSAYIGGWVVPAVTRILTNRVPPPMTNGGTETIASQTSTTISKISTPPKIAVKKK